MNPILVQDDQPAPDEAEAIARIVAAAQSVIAKGYGSPDGVARRDVHAKHHGCVACVFEVASEETFAALQKQLGVDLRRGVFQPGKRYHAWARFSNGNKRLRSDDAGDARGIGLKLIDAPENGPRLEQADPGQGRTQDFVLSTYPAFFARNAQDMAQVAELEANDKFPSQFFGDEAHVRGLVATVKTSQLVTPSPLRATYFSQVPYALGDDLAVKYRLVPKVLPAKLAAAEGANRLFDALRDELDPALGATAVVFELGVQLRGAAERFPIDDATVVWPEEESQFIAIAQLLIPPQQTSGERKMELAERISFNPWNGLAAHKPLGSINRARLAAYRASFELRRDMNAARQRFARPAPRYDVAEWEELLALTDDVPTQGLPARGVGAAEPWFKLAANIFPSTVKQAADFFTKRGAFVVPAALLLSIILFGTWCKPSFFCKPIGVGLSLPSEARIPAAVYSDAIARKLAADPHALDGDMRYRFRYLPTGSEQHGGTPYWIFRVLPRMFPENFGGRTDYAALGLNQKDDQEYFESYHGLPRGLVLSDAVEHIAGTEVELQLKRVSFNCASCHRGEYLDSAGHAQHVDGMPNHGIDTAAYKRAMFTSMSDPRFTPAAVMKAIEALWAEEFAHETPLPKLSLLDRVAYEGIVRVAQAEAHAKKLAWMGNRPENGLGRLDAFGALRFEFLNGDPAHDPSVATVDLPSIWNQSRAWRPWHHYDGNTDDERARNFGAIVGVGADAYSIRSADVQRIGHWIDDELHAPPYPFEDKSDAATLAAGKAVYDGQCAQCHGTYDGAGYEAKKLRTPTWCMTKVVAGIGTDPERAKAADPVFIDELNRFGATAGVWSGGNTFRFTGGYLCPPLDGLWARAPYLHNGSVPTLDALLKDEANRPPTFIRGNPKYDTKHGGFVSEYPSDRAWFEQRALDHAGAPIAGNSNKGHSGADQLVRDDKQRADLIRYLLSL